MNSVGNGATNITNNSVENPPQNMEGPILAEAVQLVTWMENDHRRRMQNFCPNAQSVSWTNTMRLHKKAYFYNS